MILQMYKKLLVHKLIVCHFMEYVVTSKDIGFSLTKITEDPAELYRDYDPNMKLIPNT